MNIPKLKDFKKSGASAYLKWLSTSKYDHCLDTEPKQIRFGSDVTERELERLQRNFILVSNFCEVNRLDIWEL